MSKVKIGVIGAGVLGNFHLQKCMKNADVECVGFFDVNATRAETIVQQTKARFFSSTTQLIDVCDALIIATPSSTHVAMAGECIDAKKHVLIEKPLAPSYAEGADLVKRACDAGTIVHVGHSESFNAAFVKLMTYAPKPRFVEIHRLAQFSPRGTDVPVVLDLMVHDLQLLLRLCGEEPVYNQIAATGVPVVSDDIDIANVRIPFPSGCVANITASRISAKRMRKLRLFARDNYYSVDLDKEEVERYALVRNTPTPQTGLPVSFSCDKVPHADALETELAAFVAAIQGTSAVKGVDGTEALAVLKITDTILSLIQQNPV